MLCTASASTTTCGMIASAVLIGIWCLVMLTLWKIKPYLSRKSKDIPFSLHDNQRGLRFHLYLDFPCLLTATTVYDNWSFHFGFYEIILTPTDYCENVILKSGKQEVTLKTRNGTHQIGFRSSWYFKAWIVKIQCKRSYNHHVKAKHGTKMTCSTHETKVRRKMLHKDWIFMNAYDLSNTK